MRDARNEVDSALVVLCVACDVWQCRDSFRERGWTSRRLFEWRVCARFVHDKYGYLVSELLKRGIVMYEEIYKIFTLTIHDFFLFFIP